MEAIETLQKANASIFTRIHFAAQHGHNNAGVFSFLTYLNGVDVV